jgi:hypothetical protein
MDISGWVHSAAKTLYRSIPAPVRNIATPAATWYDRFWRLRPEVWLVSGEERSSNLPFNTVIYVLTRQHRRYLTDLIYGDRFRERCLGRSWIWNAFRKLPAESNDAHAIFAEIHQAHLRYLNSERCVLIPAWITGEADLQVDKKLLRHKSIRSDIRKMEINQLEGHFRRDMESFEDFYQNMYVPHVKKTYGDAGFVLSLRQLRTRFENSRLIIVEKQREAVGGMLVSFENGSPYLRHVGVREGKRELVNEGVIGAAYEFAFRNLEKEGFSKVRLGRSRAFLKDGVLQFKKKRAQTIVSVSTHKFAFQPLRDTDSTQAFLRNNPFIFEDAKNGLSGVVFVAAGTPLTAKLLHATYEKYFQIGLARLIVFFLSAERPLEFPETVLEFVNTELRRFQEINCYCEALPEIVSTKLNRLFNCRGVPIAIYPNEGRES